MSNKRVNEEQYVREVLWETLPLALGLCVGTAALLGRAIIPLSARSRRRLLVAAVVSLLLIMGSVWRLLFPAVESMRLNAECSVYFDEEDSLCDGHHTATREGGGRGGGDICVKIITYFDPRQYFGLLSSKWNRQYAQRWGLRFQRHTSGCTLSHRAPQWTKIALLHEEMLRGQPDWVVWIDADAIFTNYDINLAQILDGMPMQTVMVVSRDMGAQFGRPINSGFMAVRVGGRGRELLRRIWSHGAAIRKRHLFGHEQEALTSLMALDKEVYDQVWVLKDMVRMFSEKVDEKSDPHLWRHGDLAAHAAGWPGKKAKIHALKVMRKLSILS